MSKTPWEIEDYPHSNFSEEFHRLSDTSKELVKDLIVEIVHYENPEEHPYASDCHKKPTDIDDSILIRFPNTTTEVMIGMDEKKHKICFIHCED